MRKVIRDIRNGKQLFDCPKPEDILNATIQSQSIERLKSNEDLLTLATAKQLETPRPNSADSKNETDDVNNEIKNGTSTTTVLIDQQPGGDGDKLDENEVPQKIISENSKGKLALEINMWKTIAKYSVLCIIILKNSTWPHISSNSKKIQKLPRKSES